MGQQRSHGHLNRENGPIRALPTAGTAQFVTATAELSSVLAVHAWDPRPKGSPGPEIRACRGWGVGAVGESVAILPSPGHTCVCIPRRCLDMGMCVLMCGHTPTCFPALVALPWPRIELRDCGLSDRAVAPPSSRDGNDLSPLPTCIPVPPLIKYSANLISLCDCHVISSFCKILHLSYPRPPRLFLFPGKGRQGWG